jgi:catechol 2,3-dioxygenase-like lactoylglutathione lyase family enzyme
MALNPRFGFVLEYVSDLAATKDFYVNILGLEVERFHPTFVQFKDPTGDHFAIATDESLTGTRERELYWVVDDAEAAFREISARAAIELPLTMKPFGKVFGVKDPAGQVQFLIEFAATRPSRPVGGSG